MSKHRLLEVVFVTGLSLCAAIPGTMYAQQQPGPDLSVPPPPAKVGCYQYRPNGWKESPCAADAFVKAHYPHLKYSLAIQSTAKTSGSVKGQTVPLVFGEVKIYFDSVGSITDSKYGANAFSLQDNPNIFKGSNGQTDWVQFTVQSSPSAPDGLCIWNIDTATQKYTPLCVPVPRLRSGGFIPGDKPIIHAFSIPGYLQVMFWLPWEFPPGLPIPPWAVVAPDKYGLYGRWNEQSGWVLGFGDGSQLSFSSGVVWTRIAASSCQGDLGAGNNPKVLCPGQPEFKPSASVVDAAVTEEGNNLLPVIGAPPVHVPPLDWRNSDLVWIDFVATKSGKCPAGTSEPLCGVSAP